MRALEYPTEPFDVRENGGSQVLWCRACGKPVSHCTKNRIDQHLRSKSHLDGVERLRKMKSLQVQKSEEAAKHPVQPMPLTGRQTTLDNHTEAVGIRRQVQDDLVLMALTCGIPTEKFDHPLFRQWLAKYTTIHGCIPQLSGDFPRLPAERLYYEMFDKMKELLRDTELALMFDEWTDDSGIATLAVVACTAKARIAIDVVFLEGQGKNSGVDHIEVAQQLTNTTSRLGLDTNRIKFVMCDEGSVMVAAYKALRVSWPKAQLILCMAHKLNNVGKALQKLEDFKCLSELLFAGSQLVAAPKYSARKRRWLKFLKKKRLPQTVPPKVGETRWNAWVDASHWWCANILAWKEFIEEESRRSTSTTNQDTKSFFERHHEFVTKSLVSTTIKLCYVGDHLAPLIAAINESQKDESVGPHLFDVYMNLHTYYKELLKTQKYSPRVEELMQKLRNTEPLREILLKGTRTVHDALELAFAERKYTLDLLKEMRALHPNNLTLVSHSQSDYPILFAERPDLSFNLGTYFRASPTNLHSSSKALQDWWDMQPASPLKDNASFLIRLPFSSGSVERFFSIAKLQDDQSTMGDFMRRLTYMCRFNGDLTNRLSTMS